jgi:hypothetical protein
MTADDKLSPVTRRLLWHLGRGPMTTRELRLYIADPHAALNRLHRTAAIETPQTRWDGSTLWRLTPRGRMMRRLWLYRSHIRLRVLAELNKGG